MSQAINFLPPSYHRKHLTQRKRVWRRGVFAVFLALIAAGAIGQWQSRSRLEETRDSLRKQVADLNTKLAGRDELARQIELLDFRADLIAGLSIHTRPTRVLSSIVGSLPRFVTLTELHAEYVESREPRVESREPEAETEKPSAAQIDLDQLRQAVKRNSLFVMLTGIAPDDVAISRYLVALEETNTFDEVRLLFTDQYSMRDRSLRQFGIRVRVRKPGSCCGTVSRPWHITVARVAWSGDQATTCVESRESRARGGAIVDSRLSTLDSRLFRNLK